MNWLRNALRNWLMVTAAIPVAATVPQMNVKQSAVDQVSEVRQDGLLTPISYAPDPIELQRTFEPYTPPPGVVPEAKWAKAKMAADNVWNRFGGPAFFQTVFNEGIGFMGYPYLAELTQRPEYRRISETLAKEMTRKWVKIVSTGDSADDKTKKIKKIEAEMRRLKVKSKFRRMAELDGFFGRGQLYVDMGTENPKELNKPLIMDPRKVPIGGLKGLQVVEPVWSYPSAYNSDNPLRADFYRPQLWFVMGKEIHHTRLLTFVGREMPDLLKATYAFGGLSLSQMAKPYVDNWLRTRQSVSDLVSSFSKDVLATNMGDVLNQGAATGLINRAQIYNQFRDNREIRVLDKETEEFTNVSTPLTTLDALQAQSQEQMASVAKIPLVILLGVTPSGLNASSDGEIRTFYDWIGAEQEHLFDDHLTTILKLIQLSLFGEIDEDIGYQFNPLWQLDEAGKASVAKTRADTHAVYLQESVVSAEEVREAVANDPDSPYANLDLGGPPPEPEPDEDDEGLEVSPAPNADPAKAQSGKSGV